MYSAHTQQDCRLFEEHILLDLRFKARRLSDQRQAVWPICSSSYCIHQKIRFQLDTTPLAKQCMFAQLATTTCRTEGTLQYILTTRCRRSWVCTTALCLTCCTKAIFQVGSGLLAAYIAAASARCMHVQHASVSACTLWLVNIDGKCSCLHMLNMLHELMQLP